MRVMIDGYSANMRFSSSHIMPGIGKCGRLHGHTYYVHVSIEGEQGEDGLVIDFTVLKGYIREMLETLDHKVIIPEKNGRMKVLRNDDIIEVKIGDKHYKLPSDDCVLLPLPTSSAEDISKYLLSILVKKIKDNAHDNIKIVKVRVDEGPGQGAEVSVKIGGN